MHQRAFSLVELSIVLVILGLLTGGILAGQSLIRAAELRSIGTDVNRFVSATQTFRDKYLALPGDMLNATSFWGKNNTACSGDSGTANATTGVCNGNGNGYIADSASIAGGTSEGFQFWRQLANAGLIEGTYTGLAGASSVNDALVGTNVPRSKISNAGFTQRALTGLFAGNSNAYSGQYDNFIQFGGQITGTTTAGALLRPEEAWNIDIKMDDGRPATGKIIPRDTTGFGIANGCTTSASATDVSGNYNLSVSAVNCSLYFIRAY